MFLTSAVLGCFAVGNLDSCRYVKNLDGDVKEEDLKALFESYGTVVNVEYKSGSNYCFVEYAQHEG